MVRVRRFERRVLLTTVLMSLVVVVAIALVLMSEIVGVLVLGDGMLVRGRRVLMLFQVEVAPPPSPVRVIASVTYAVRKRNEEHAKHENQQPGRAKRGMPPKAG